MHGVRAIAGLADLALSVAGALVAALVVGGWYGVGAAVLRFAPGAPRATFAVATTLGAGVSSLAWFALGLAGVYGPGVALVVLVLSLALAVVAYRHGATLPPVWPDRAAALPLAMAALAVAAAVVAALAPPTSKDALQYHLALPKAFAAAERLVVVAGTPPSFFPLGLEMNGLAAMLAGRALSGRVGEAAFGATTCAFFVLALLFVHDWVAERASRAWAATAAALLATVPVAYEAASGASVDIALGLYVAIATRAATRWWETGDRGDLSMMSLALGFAAGTKVLALPAFAVLAVVVLLAARRRGGGGVAVTAALGAGALVAAPWFVRTWIMTGSPLYPFFLDLWPASAEGWDVSRSVMFRSFNAAFGGGRDIVDFLVLPFRLSLFGAREVPTLYESAPGVAFFVAAPLVLWAMRRRALDRGTIVVAAVAAVMFVWWASAAQVVRYLLIAMPLAAVIAVRAAAALGVARATLLVPAGASLALLLAWFVTDAPMLSVVGAERRADYLSRRLDYYSYYRTINDALPPGARVWLINTRRDVYHLDRPFFGDYLFEDYTLRRQIEAGRDASRLREWTRGEGITHVFVRHDALLDFARSSLVDETLPREVNESRLRRVRAFFSEGTRILRADAKFALIELPK
jgi:hypothetical protein